MRSSLILFAMLMPIAVSPCSLASEPGLPSTTVDLACDYCGDFTDQATAHGLVQTAWRPGGGYPDRTAMSSSVEFEGSQPTRAFPPNCASSSSPGCVVADTRR